MAFSTTASPSAQTITGIGGEHGFGLSKAELRKFQRSINVLRHALHEDLSPNTRGVLIIEYYMHLLEKAYLQWKRHHRGPKSLR
jgi:hypothetical protein